MNRPGDRLVELVRVDPAGWDEKLAGSGRPFRFTHGADAGRALEKGFPEYRFEPLEVGYADGTRLLFPLVTVERRLPALTLRLGMPLDWEGTPVAAEGSPTSGKLRALFSALGGRGALRIVGGTGGSPPGEGLAVRKRTSHVLDLEPGYETIWSESFSGKNRTSCRKAHSLGVEARRADGSAAWATYYGLYAAASRDWGHATPPYPASLVQALAESDRAELWLGYREERVVAGAILLAGSEDVFYWSGAMDREGGVPGATNEVLRAAIESSSARGYRSMDFGSSEGLPGVRRFKESFGARPTTAWSVEVSSPGYRFLEGALRRVRRPSTSRG